MNQILVNGLTQYTNHPYAFAVLILLLIGWSLILYELIHISNGKSQYPIINWMLLGFGLLCLINIYPLAKTKFHHDAITAHQIYQRNKPKYDRVEHQINEQEANLIYIQHALNEHPKLKTVKQLSLQQIEIKKSLPVLKNKATQIAGTIFNNLPNNEDWEIWHSRSKGNV